MKNKIIASIVGALIIFIWQTVSWTGILGLHNATQQYTPKQDSIMTVLNQSFTEDGGYILPGLPKGTSSDEMMKAGEKMQGKPWATIQYHKSYTFDMISMFINMIRGFLTDIVMVFLLCLILSKFSAPSFNLILISCLFVGAISFLYVPYPNYMWYRIFDIYGYLIDAIAGWGLTGIWVGWWMTKKNK